MKSKIYLLLTAYCLLLIMGCKPKQKLVDTNIQLTNQTVFIHDKLTPVALRVDSSVIRAKFECDSNYNVVLAELNEVKSKNIQSSFDWTNDYFVYKLHTGGDTVYIPGTDFYFDRNVYINRRIETTRTKTITVEKKRSWFENLFIATGLVVWLFVFGYIIYIIAKNYISIKNYLQKLLQFKK